jgi:PAS domain S-box-containing protein
MDFIHANLLLSGSGILLAYLAGMALLFWYLKHKSDHKHWAWVPIFGVLLYLLTNKFTGMLDHVEAEHRQAVNDITEHLLFTERLTDLLVFAVLSGTITYLWLSQLKTRRSKSEAHRQAEQTLREQEQFLGEMIATAFEGVMVVNENGDIESFSPSAERIFGYSADEIIGRSIDTLIPERFRTHHRRYFEKFLTSPHLAENKKAREVQGLRRDGTERTLNFSLFKIQSENGMKVAGIARDLTESKHAQQMLVDSNRRLELLLSVSSAANTATTLGEAIQCCLDTVCKMTDWPIGHVYFADAARADHLVPGNIWHFKDPQRFIEFRQETQKRTFERGSGLPGKVLEKDCAIWLEKLPLQADCERNTAAHAAGIISGAAFPVRSNGKIIAVLEFYSHRSMQHEPELIDVMTAICTQLAHVMERDHTAEETKRLNETLTEVLDSTPIGVSVQRDDGTYLFVNEQQVKNLRATNKKELLINAEKSGVPPTEFMERNPDGEIVSRTVQNQTLRRTRLDGSDWYARVNIRPFRYFGETASIVWMEDITEQKAAEDARRAHERDLRAIVDSSRASIYLCDRDGRILLVNSELESRLGQSASEIIGKTANDLVSSELAELYTKFNAEVIETGKVLEKVYEQDYPDGTVRTILSTKSPIRDESGETIGVSTINTDISAIKQAEKALRENETLFNAFLDNTDSPITLQDTLGRYILVNKKFAEIRGLPVEALIGKTAFQLLPAKQAQIEMSQDRKVALTRESIRDEFDAVNSAGETRRYIISRFPVVGDDGRVIAVGQISTDITDRIQAEEALRTSEARFKILLDHMDTPVTMKDLNGRYLVANKSFLNSVNLPPESIEGRMVGEVFDRDVTRDVSNRDGRVAGNGETIHEEFEKTNTAGQLRQYVASRFPIFDNNRNAIAVGRICTDITEHVRARKELEEAEKQLRIALENMPGGLFTYDTDLNFQIVTQTFIDTYQVPAQLARTGEPVGKVVEFRAKRGDYGPGDLDTLIRDRIRDFQDPDVAHFLTNVPGRVTEVVRRPLRDGGKVVVFRDVTQRVEAEKALAQSEAKYRDLFERAPVMMHSADNEARILDVNQSWLNATGYSREDVIGKMIHDFMTAGSVKFLNTNALPEFLQKGYIEDVSLQMRKKNGAVADMMLTATAERDKNGKVSSTNTVLIDVTERNRAARALEEAREAAEAANKAKSNFLASMSHEIRTPMNGVLGTLDLLRQTKLLPDQANLTNMAFDSADSLLDIIDDILDFSKIEAGEMKIENIDVSINDVVEGVAETLLPVAANKNIDIDIFVDPSIPETVAIDPVRLRQILLNLTGNAVKFTESKDDTHGSVEIRVERIPFDDPHLVAVRFKVVDTGIGIPEDTLEDLFKPFTQAEASTTRRFGGTGLGLAISKELTELIGGQLSATSSVGKGSTFCVEFLLEPGKSRTNENSTIGLHGVRILAAMMNGKIKSVVSSYLSALGAQLDFVESIGEAKLKIQNDEQGTQPYAVILVDGGRPRRPRNIEDEIIALGEDPLFANMGVVILSGGRPTGTFDDMSNAVLLQAPPIRRNSLVRAVATRAGLIEDRIGTDTSDENRTPATPPSRTEAEKRNQLILIVEDNPTNQEVIRRQIGFLGYAADVVDNGVDALKALDESRYSIVITDCHMPKMDGFELTGAIREREKGTGSRIPIIAITGNALQGEANRCIAAGMDGYLAKPVKLMKLGDILENFMSQTSCYARKNAAAIRNPDAHVQVDATALPTARASSAAPHGTDITDEAERPGEICAGASRKPIASSVPPQDEPIDFELLATVLGSDNKTYMQEILSVFWECVADTAEELAALAAAREAGPLRNAAHSAKGAAASAGANHVSKLLARLETAAVEEDWSQVEDLMPTIGAAFVDLKQFIQDQT